MAAVVSRQSPLHIDHTLGFAFGWCEGENLSLSIELERNGNRANRLAVFPEDNFERQAAGAVASNEGIGG